MRRDPSPKPLPKRLPGQRWISPRWLAFQLGVSQRSVVGWISNGTGPRNVRLAEQWRKLLLKHHGSIRPRGRVRV